MTPQISLSPLFSTSVGFDRFDDLFDNLPRFTEENEGFPPYNIEREGEDRYAISLAVPGFNLADLHISVRDGELTVAGRRTAEEQARTEYLYRGLGLGDFRRTFRLADYVVVTGAELKDGLLRIGLVREVPDDLKPRRIEIRTKPDMKALGNPQKAA